MLDDQATIESMLMAFVLGLPRMLAALGLLSFFSRNSSTAMFRLGISAAFNLPLLPALMAQIGQQTLTTGALTVLLLKEAALGLMLGFATAIPFWATEAAGFFIDNQRGASTAGLASAETGDEGSSLGTLINQSYAVLFLLMGGLSMVVGVVYQSHALWPATAMLPHFSSTLAAHYLGLCDSIMQVGMVLAAPAMVAMLLTELALALVSLFAPQLQVYFLAMPIKSGVALFVLVVYFSTALQYLSDTVSGVPGILLQLRNLMQ